MSIDVKEPVTDVQTVEEFDALLKKFKVQFPEKYAIKLANGEFDKFRSKLLGFQPKVEKEDKEKVVKPKVEKEDKEKVVKPKVEKEK